MRLLIDAVPKVVRTLFVATTPASTMTPEQALDRQIERYRAMTGEERLRIALDLHAFSCDVAREAIRRRIPQRRCSTRLIASCENRLEAAYR